MQITKRNKQVVPFDINRVVNAIFAAMKDVGEGSRHEATEIAKQATDFYKKKQLSTVEELQDVIEELLMAEHAKTAKAYIIYRYERTQQRAKIRTPYINTHYKMLTEEFLKPFFKKPNPFNNPLGEFVYYRTYARAVPQENRRETWAETVERVVEFSADLEVIAMKKSGQPITPAYLKGLQKTAEQMYRAMYNFELFPSGRSLFVGGTPASYSSPISNMNCSFMTMDDVEKFSELFYVLMCGTGVGLSLEKKYVNTLPKFNTRVDIIHQDYRPVPAHERKEHTSISERQSGIIDIEVGDSRYGWAKAIEFYLDILSKKQYADINFVVFNFDNVRPIGERLKTFGGFSSGHGALKTILTKIDDIVKRQKNGQWTRMRPIDILDMATSVAEGVVSGK